MSLATLLVLADGRLPAGGHAHSGGFEAAVSAARVRDHPRGDRLLHAPGVGVTPGRQSRVGQREQRS